MIGEMANRSLISETAVSPHNVAGARKHSVSQPMQLVQDCVLNQDLQTVLPNIVEHLVAAWRPRLEAIVLTGSFARGEGSALRSANCLQVLGDMEFMLFYSPQTNLTVVDQALAQT